MHKDFKFKNYKQNPKDPKKSLLIFERLSLIFCCIFAVLYL